MKHAAVIGGGSWGTALAMLLASKEQQVMMWARDKEAALEMQLTRENRRYLPGVRLPESLQVTSDLRRTITGCDMVLLVVPSHTVRSVVRHLREEQLSEHVPIVSASKGIENESLDLMSDVLAHELGPGSEQRLAFLSGPSFATEVALGKPAAIVMASQNESLAQELQARFSSERMRVYANSDVVGVEMGGALKNVIAIAAGAVDGLELGLNARAALITRGLNEIARLAMAKGGNALTLAGLAGLGDLVLTCTGQASRNRTVGYELGRGRTLPDILAGMTQVAEGVRTAKSAFELAQKLGVEAPITNEVYQVLYTHKPAKQAVNDLMTRALRSEW